MLLKKRGYTAIEIVLVIGIMGILVTMVGLSFSAFRNSNILAVETEKVVSLIAQARNDTLSSKNDTVYGVRVESGRVVLFESDTFSEVDPDNIEISLDTSVALTDIVLNGGGSDIVFKRLSGKTNEHGTMSLVLTSDPTTKKTITIYATGLVDIN
ncbi:MAG: type II secretion system protein [Candidatus Pacebacteria bacterium]|nr:type II secretion system protein [Candidatus Paceibacterota bacterium]